MRRPLRRAAMRPGLSRRLHPGPPGAHRIPRDPLGEIPAADGLTAAVMPDLIRHPCWRAEVWIPGRARDDTVHASFALGFVFFAGFAAFAGFGDRAVKKARFT